MWDYPRFQIAALLIVVLGLIVWRRRGRWRTGAAAGIAALAWQASHFGAYLPLAPKAVASARQCDPARTLSLLNINVLQTNRNYRAVIELIRAADADIVLLLETGPEWERALAPLSANYPNRAGEAVPNTYGLILLSKLPMKGQLLHRMQPGVPSVAARLRLRDGSEVVLHGVHPEPPIPGNDSGQRDAELVLVGREVRKSGDAAIVMGDLNDVAWSRTSRLFREVSGMRDPRGGRGLYPTFNAKYPLLRWPLDHLFVTPHFKLMAIDRLDDIGSDHFPMLFKLCLTAPAGRRLTAPRADPDVREEAAEEVQEGKQATVDEARGE